MAFLRCAIAQLRSETGLMEIVIDANVGNVRLRIVLEVKELAGSLKLREFYEKILEG
jgi:hypothetical protein